MIISDVKPMLRQEAKPVHPLDIYKNVDIGKARSTITA
jgi:hypothetical protein